MARVEEAIHTNLRINFKKNLPGCQFVACCRSYAFPWRMPVGPAAAADGGSEAHGASATRRGNVADRISAGLQARGGHEAVRVARNGAVAGHVEDGAAGTIQVILVEYTVVVVL